MNDPSSFCPPRSSSCRPDYDPYTIEERRDSVSFRGLFKMIDTDQSGYISTDELQDALSLAFPIMKIDENGDECVNETTSFNTFAVEIFIQLVDKDKSGKIEYLEFYQLLQMMKRWIALFKHFTKLGRKSRREKIRQSQILERSKSQDQVVGGESRDTLTVEGQENPVRLVCLSPTQEKNMQNIELYGNEKEIRPDSEATNPDQIASQEKRYYSHRTMAMEDLRLALTSMGWADVVESEELLNLILSIYSRQESYDIKEQAFAYRLAMDDFIAVCGKIQLLKTRYNLLRQQGKLRKNVGFVKFGINDLNDFEDLIQE